MIESIRNDEQSVLLLDCGAVFNDRPKYQKYKAETILKVMELMGYDVLNLGIPEFHFGKDFLKDTCSYTSFPYVASNLLYDGKKFPWTEEYIIKDINGLKIAIIGLINPDNLKKSADQEYVENLEVIPAEIALQRLLPEIRAKADMIILLSRLGFKQTCALLKKVDGIDIVISSGDRGIYPANICPEKNILQTGTGGRTLGYARIALNEKGTVSVEEAKFIPLGESLPEDDRINDIIRDAFKAHRAKKANLDKKQTRMKMEELMEGLKLSPREFIEQYKKEQLGKSGGTK